MFKIKNSKSIQSKFLMSDQILKKLVSDDPLLSQIDREYDFSVVDEAVIDLYCLDNGRPPVPPSVLFKASLIQCLKGYSDMEMEFLFRTLNERSRLFFTNKPYIRHNH